jgi:hypothetical protein
MNIEQAVIDILRSEIVRCIKELLETKHLYQSVRIDLTPINRMSDEAEKTVEMDEAHEIAGLTFLGRNVVEQRVKGLANEYRKTINHTVEAIMGEFWSFSTDTVNNLILAKGGKLPNQITHFTLPTICAPCQQCDAILPAHNSGFTGQMEEMQTVSWQRIKNEQKVLLQTLVFPYQCQACKNEPLIFIVHREGSKLTLAGRNHFESVQVPKTIPGSEARFFSDAVVAFNTGNILAGIFLLRTIVEQYMRRILNVTEKRMTGDELADFYAALLDDEFPKRYPSLKVIYDELSIRLHSADGDSAQFEKSKQDIEMHFELLRHFPLKQPKR